MLINPFTGSQLPDNLFVIATELTQHNKKSGYPYYISFTHMIDQRMFFSTN